MAASGRLTRPVLVILGATGAGKSKLAVEMSTLFNGEIISADSMQLYQGLDIVTNKPTKEELALCRHHLVNFVSPLRKNSTVIEYSRTALSIIDTLLDEDKLPVIVGGTNYYVEALLWKFLLPSRQVSTLHEGPSSMGYSDLCPQFGFFHVFHPSSMVICQIVFGELF
ncbi:hypothetical protein NP493_479g02010 [Ridgeia piscesae]|uniref:Uncharacterized protein n=1 Tax=Ridgeia piscesae TaxID=27915 RepID=A0AAD9KZC1_RIDPI|nr:hypothetical protein NP493_479g02010 [Ridgeia piscesae]